MLRSIRKLYWRLKYRPSRTFEFCFAIDGFTDILIVENRVASTGTLVYRKRCFNPWAPDQCEFGPPREDTVPEMIRRAKSDDW